MRSHPTPSRRRKARPIRQITGMLRHRACFARSGATVSIIDPRCFSCRQRPTRPIGAVARVRPTPVPQQISSSWSKFLYGGGRKGRRASKRARTLFGTVGEELRKGTPSSKRARSARADLTALLTRVMSRTERPRKAIEDGARNGNDGVREAPLLPTDISIFRHLTECLRPDDHGWAVPLWQSVPLPMQALGSRYQAWRNSRSIPPRRDIALTPDVRRRLRTTGPWPHPRLRALLEEMPLLATRAAVGGAFASMVAARRRVEDRQAQARDRWKAIGLQPIPSCAGGAFGAR